MPTSRKAYMDGLIDARMLRALFGAAREHGIGSEELHDAASFNFGKSSLKDLTRREACRMLDGIRGKVHFNASGVTGARRHAMAFHGHKDYDHSGDPLFLVNERELQMLREAAERRGWDDAALRKFCQRQTGNDLPRTMAEFNKVFQPLKTMNRRMGL